MARVKFLLRSDNNRRLQVKLARKVKRRWNRERKPTENGLINRVNCPFTTWTKKKKKKKKKKISVSLDVLPDISTLNHGTFTRGKDFSCKESSI